MLALATAAACALAVSSPTPRLDAHAALAPVSVLRAATGERVRLTEEWSSDISSEMVQKIKTVEAEISSGARHVYDGPIFNQDGEQMVAAGTRLDDGAILGINWHVQGVNTPLPQ